MEPLNGILTKVEPDLKYYSTKRQFYKVDDKNLHIDPSLNNEYPVPDIPVDQAWESMQLLLDSPVNTVTPAKPEGIAFSWKVGFYSLILFVIISLLSWWLLSEKKLQNENLRVKSVNNIATNNTSKNNTGQQIINDSLTTNIIFLNLKSKIYQILF